ncbi:MAG: dihydrofolate reductase [Bacteroidetes bacterium]|nr:dihydrofolate reductase [Fibrella sp.]
MKISLIAAVAANGVIGRDNQKGEPDMPWRLPDDSRFFKQKTIGHPVIMGRRSFDALGKPLPNRLNIVITRNADYRAEGATVVPSLEEAMAAARSVEQDEIFIIGGAQVYALGLTIGTTLYLTEIQKAYEGETHFPAFDKAVWEEVERRPHPADERHEAAFDFVTYERK